MKTILIGIGNPVLTDDAVGIKVAEQLSGFVDTRVLTTTGFDVIDAVLGYDRALIIDGVCAGAKPGTILELNTRELMADLEFSGTHNMHLGAALDLGYRLFGREMPSEIIIFAVELQDVVNFSTHCTPAVEAAIPELVQRVRAVLEN